MQRTWAHIVFDQILRSLGLHASRFAFVLFAMFQAAGGLAQSLPQLRISDIHGQTWNGALVSLDQETLVYKPAEATNSAEVAKKADEIVGLVRPGAKSNRSNDSGAWVAGLTDGSVLVAEKLEGKEKDWTVQFSSKLTQNGFAGEFRYLKFKKLDSKAQESWEAYLREDLKSDALIVVRPGGALDRVDGVVKEIRDGKVQFDVDGQIVEASAERLAGVLWYRKQPAVAPKGFQVQLSNGSSLVGQRAKVIADGALELQGAWGSLNLPVDWLQGIDCGLDKMAWVSSLPVLESRSLRKGGFGEFDAVLAKTGKPRWVQGEFGAEGLLFPGSGEYLFRAPQGMTKFTGRVERAIDTEAQSLIWIEVWVDDQRAQRKELGVDQQSLDIEVAIVSEKKIKIVVGSKSALQLGTRMVLIQPRVSK